MNSWWIVAVVAVIGVFIISRLRGGGSVSKEVLLERIKAGAQIIDVRGPDEFRGGGYPGAVNIPLQALGARMGEIKKDKPVIVYCASGGRSASAARMLAGAGYADVVNGGGLSDMPRR